jgi:hypothetical protein
MRTYTEPPKNERDPKSGNVSFLADCPLCGGLVLFGYDETEDGCLVSDGTAQCTKKGCDYFWKADYLIEAEARWEAEEKARKTERRAEQERIRAAQEEAQREYRVLDHQTQIARAKAAIAHTKEELYRERQLLARLEAETDTETMLCSRLDCEASIPLTVTKTSDPFFDLTEAILGGWGYDPSAGWLCGEHFGKSQP